jgi:F-type H+-transporting ATPase subunit alpha
VVEYEAAMLSFMRAEHGDVLAEIRDSRAFEDATKGKLVKALDAFAKQFA